MLEIEIVYGTAEKQILRSIRIEQGATARTAVLQSGLDKDFPELDLNAAPLGIFGKRVQRRRFCCATETVSRYTALTD